MSHSDTVSILPRGMPGHRTQPRRHPRGPEVERPFQGIQFHPEVSHTAEGVGMLKNFLAQAKDLPNFKIASFKDELVGRVRKEVGGRKVVCGVFGGVDSSVLAAPPRGPVDTRNIFVDTGLLRADEAAEVQSLFGEVGIAIETIDASERFLTALKASPIPRKSAASSEGSSSRSSSTPSVTTSNCSPRAPSIPTSSRAPRVVPSPRPSRRTTTASTVSCS